MSVNREKNNYGKTTNTSITRISNPAIGTKIIFETYNYIIEVLPHSLSVCEIKHIQKMSIPGLEPTQFVSNSTAITR
jgi:hypothetical protein